MAFLTLFFLLGGTAARAESETYTFETISGSSTSASALTAANYAASSSSALNCGALISIETADIRFRTDGTAPTNAIGHKVTAGNSFTLDSLSDVSKLQMIGVSAAYTAQVSFVRGCR